ncbi:transmembrane 7 superfamily member 3-like [Asterias amurensis]|uniref:transmembrane 7 superfamily member 3-like n=1 Tax=Asterias amurensis TaxID=7602 RepID=UPI003AB86AB3
MELHSLWYVLLILQVTAVFAVQDNAVCQLTKEGVLHLNLSTSTLCDLPPQTNIRVRSDSISPSTTYILFTVQIPNIPLLASLEPEPTLDQSINTTSSSVGLVTIFGKHGVVGSWVEWYLMLMFNDTAQIQLLAQPYLLQDKTNRSFSAPIPGACNQEFDLENDPNLHLSNTSAMNITLLEFAPANVGTTRGEDPPLCDSGEDSARFRLTYDLYILNFGSLQLDEDNLFTEMYKMSTVQNVLKNGQKIKSYTGKDMTEFYQVNYRTRGAIYNLVVTDPKYDVQGVYVPSIIYSCDLKKDSIDCTDDVDFGVILIATFTGLAGLVICMCGHRIFNYEIFFFGFVPFFIGSFMIIGALVPMTPFALSIVALCFGLVGGTIHFALWWRFGKYLWSMLLAGFNLGFLFSALVFFITPLENLTTFHSNAVFGLSFVCGVLIVPVGFLFFPKMLSMVSTAVWGSYLVCTSISYFTTGILHYLIYNVLRRATMEKYALAYHAAEFEIIDYVLFTSWFISSVFGVVLQHRLTKDSATTFPPCPYDEWKGRQKICLMEPDERQIQQVAGGYQPSENSPLLGDQVS